MQFILEDYCVGSTIVSSTDKRWCYLCFREVCYEPVQSSLLRSLWRVELFKMRSVTFFCFKQFHSVHVNQELSCELIAALRRPPLWSNSGQVFEKPWS